MSTVGYVAIAVVGVVILAGIVFAAMTYSESSGVVITRESNLTGFSAVQVGDGFRVNITYSDIYSVRVTTDDNIMNSISLSIDNGTLIVQFNPGTFMIIHPTVDVEITMPALSEVDLSGGTQGNIIGFLNLNQTRFQTALSGGSILDIPLINVGSFFLSLSGGSSLNGKINSAGTASSNLMLSGGSSADLSGTSGNITIDASGGSMVNMLDMSSHDINVMLSGGSGAKINLDGRLDANLSGGSNIGYIGTPTMGNITLSGLSTIGPD
jgi:hypothetical protein